MTTTTAIPSAPRFRFERWAPALLLAADAGIQPADGALRAAGWDAPHVAVTAGRGLRAGEEIAAWLLERGTT